MKNWKTQNWLPVYILSAAVLSACGASSSDSSFANPSGNVTSTSGGSSSSGSSGSTSSSGSSSGSSSTSTTSLAPALQFAQFGVTGSGGKTPTYSTRSANGAYITTDNILKVRLTVANGGLLQAPSGYSGFSTNYSCASFNVYLYDDTGTQVGSATTQMLQVPGEPPCVNSTGEASQDIDFSSSVNGPHGGLEVRVTASQYDFYCKLWYDYYSMYGISSPYYGYYSYWCPSKAVYQNHTVDASLQVEVNGTTFQ